MAEEAAAPIDFTPLQSDHPRVKEILELDELNLVTRFAELSPRSLQSLHLALGKEKNVDRAISTVSLYVPGMLDLTTYETKLLARIKIAKAKALDLTTVAITQSKFCDDDGVQLAKIKRHIAGLVSVKCERVVDKKQKKARTLSPVLTPEPSDDERTAAAAAAPARRGLMGGWF